MAFSFGILMVSWIPLILVIISGAFWINSLAQRIDDLDRERDSLEDWVHKLYAELHVHMDNHWRK